MSGIAEIMSEMGFRVQGSDVSRNNNIDRLTRKKIKVFIGHKASNVNKTNIVFFSTAIKDNNIEILTAQKNNIPTLPRFKILSHLMRLKKGIAISGSHGKTTTTTMVSSILMSQNLKPTIINGGIINEIGTNTQLGSGDWMVVEADESDGTFLKLPATISVVTNIDKEHLDFYKNFSDLQKSFKKIKSQAQLQEEKRKTGEDKIIIEHPLGSIDCIVETSLKTEETDCNYIKSCGVYRTSRKIMDGNIYIPKDIENE